MQTNLFIPSKIRVGFQKRSDTFTGKLAYIIYYDEKGKIRKETSWKSWCDSSIESIEFENTPQTGYIFNKGVQRSREWGSGRSVIRVYDPRDFEFEIDVDNLIGLLMHSDVSKRDIVEPCVYAWGAGNLILLPTNSDAYQESVVYTGKQSLKVSTKDLIPGRKYHKKKTNGIVTYIGFYPWWEWQHTYYGGGPNPYNHVLKGKRHIFYEVSKYSNDFTTTSVSTLSGVASDEPTDDFAFIADNFWHTNHSQAIKDIAIDMEYTKAQYLENPNAVYTFPVMYKREQNIIYAIKTDHYYNRSALLNKLTFKSMPIDIEFGDSLSYKYREDYQSPSRYRSGYDNYLANNVSHVLKPQLTAILGDSVLDTQVTTEQYIDAMTQLGYGACSLIFENGNITHMNL